MYLVGVGRLGERPGRAHSVPRTPCLVPAQRPRIDQGRRQLPAPAQRARDDRRSPSGLWLQVGAFDARYAGAFALFIAWRLLTADDEDGTAIVRVAHEKLLTKGSTH